MLGQKPSETQLQDSPSKGQGEDNSAKKLTGRRRQSQPSLPPSASKKGPQSLDELDLESHKSVEYVYKSPEKMTTPEKKIFA